MSFSYSGDPSKSSLDKARFIVGDTVDAGHILEDAEIIYMINNCNTSNSQLLASLFRQCATVYGRRAVNRKLGPQSEDTTNRLNYFVEQALKYEKLANYSGTPPIPEYSADLVFDKGMMANDS